MNRVIIVGSPRVRGRSAYLSQELLDACTSEFPEDEVTLLSLANMEIGPCVGCGGCATGDGCIIEDDMAQVYEALDAADELIIVSPVYFAGPPSPLKALLDRLQPYFFTNARHGELRPVTLHVIGEGHDPFGYDPLVTIVESALLCAGFRVDTLYDWVGKIDTDGTILDQAEIFSLVPDDDIADEYEDKDDTVSFRDGSEA